MNNLWEREWIPKWEFLHVKWRRKRWEGSFDTCIANLQIIPYKRTKLILLSHTTGGVFFKIKRCYIIGENFNDINQIKYNPVKDRNKSYNKRQQPT